jgi:hypothetical protein
VRPNTTPTAGSCCINLWLWCTAAAAHRSNPYFYYQMQHMHPDTTHKRTLQLQQRDPSAPKPHSPPPLTCSQGMGMFSSCAAPFPLVSQVYSKIVLFYSLQTHISTAK